MRFIKVLVVFIIVIAGLGVGAYYIGTSMASEKIVEVVSAELEESGELENVKRAIESDPELKTFIDDAASIDERALPFTTKEEAVRVIVSKVGLTRLQDIQSQVQNGHMTKEDLMQEAEKILTEEEIAALKVIAYQEFYQ